MIIVDIFLYIGANSQSYEKLICYERLCNGISVTGEKETAKIVSLLTNENNIALISSRRLAKQTCWVALFWSSRNQGALPHFSTDRYLCYKLCTTICGMFSARLPDELRPKNPYGVPFFVVLAPHLEMISDMKWTATWGIGLELPINPCKY